MATLKELLPVINDGRTAVLFLAYNHPENGERKNLKIFIKKAASGLYERRLIFTDESLPIKPITNTFTERDLLADSNGIEATSDQWTLQT